MLIPLESIKFSLENFCIHKITNIIFKIIKICYDLMDNIKHIALGKLVGHTFPGIIGRVSYLRHTKYALECN